MPFRLAQGPAYFRALTQNMLGKVNGFCFFHMDNIVVHDRNEEDHLRLLKQIIEQIGKASLKLKLSKCSFFKKTPTVCRTLNFGQRNLLTYKESCITSQSNPPRDATETTPIIGLASYCRKFIANFSDIMIHLLTDLTSKNTPFV